MERQETKIIHVGNVQIGGQNKVIIQSMCDIKTSKTADVIKQINKCQKLGAEIMRVSILDEEDALAIKKIKQKITLPLVADIHFNYKLALLAIENGADKIRINPGNIGKTANLLEIINLAKKKHIPIRIGVNSGSLESDLNAKEEAQKLVESARKYVSIFENENFYDLVISLKSSNILTTIEAYKKASQIFPYPLHLGITEAGTKDIAVIRSAAGLSPLLLEGIGDTIRVSISGSLKDEILTAKRLLHDCGLYKNYPTLICCPTCGRTQVDVSHLAKKVLNYLENHNISLKVAIMGCVVNGPGEAKEADFGLAGGKDEYLLFKKGIIIKKVPADKAYHCLINEIKRTL